MKFLCLVYGDEKTLQEMPFDECIEYDTRIRESRHCLASEALHEVAGRMRARTDELAELMTREGGKPLIENRDEVGWTASAFDFYAELARTSAGA